MKHTAIITLGSNVNQEQNIRMAIDRIKSLDVRAFEVSPLIYLAAIDFPYPCDYFANSVIRLSTDMDIDMFHSKCRDIEYELGRTNSQKISCPSTIPIDIDIVVWDEDVLRPKDFQRSYFRDGLSMLDAMN